MPGNHEAKTTSDYGEAGCSKNQTGYFTYFANHGVGIASGVNGNGYYSLDLGSWHLIAINSNCKSIGGCGAGSPQETWLRGDLAAHPSQCTLAFWHEAAWSTSGSPHGVAAMRPIWADLANAGVELVLSGHFHHYERFGNLNAAGQPVPAGTGTREIVQGTGGENQGPFGNGRPIPGLGGAHVGLRRPRPHPGERRLLVAVPPGGRRGGGLGQRHLPLSPALS